MTLNTQHSTPNSLRKRLVPLATGAHGLLTQLSITATPDSSDADLLHIRVSDETLDRYQEIVVASGWRFETYQKNPVIQNCHQYSDILHTIGRAERTYIEDNALHQVWRFASAENPFAKVARDLYRGGFLKAASVGFVPIKWELGTEKSPFRRKYLEQELLEVSAVSIPANPNALAHALKSGAVQRSDLKELSFLLNYLFHRNASRSDSHLSTFNSQRVQVPPAPHNDFSAESLNSQHSTLNQLSAPTEAVPHSQSRANGMGGFVAQLLPLTRSIIELMKRA